MPLHFSLVRRLRAAFGRRSRVPRQPVFFHSRLERLEERSLLSASPATAAVSASYGQLPLAFTVNEGQAAAGVDYLAQGGGYSVALSAQQARVSLGQGSTSSTLNLQLLGASPSAQAAGQNELITKSNYLIGSDPSKWLTSLANYGQVEYQNVYQGVDAVYSGNQGKLETTFLVHPGARASVIQMQVQGAQSLSLDMQGNLVIHTSGGDVTEQAPVAYQQINGVRHAVTSRYVLERDNTVGFQVGAYDPSQTLVIDPTLSYSSYLPGNGWGIAVDGSGDTYITGAGWGSGCFAAKLNATGTALDWVTNLSSAAGKSIAVDVSGNVYVAGNASSGLPTTANALDPTMPSTSQPGFLSILAPTGSGLLYSTYLPGTQFTGNGAAFSPGADIAIDHSGDATGSLDNVYLTGAAVAGFPTTAGAFQTSFGGNRNAFIAEINPNLSGSASLLYGTYLGGTLNAASVNNGIGGWDSGSGIAVDATGNAYIVGRTASTNFPTTAGAFQTSYGGGSEDVFVAKINPSLSGAASLVYSTYLGGSGSDGYSSDYPVYINLSEPGPGIAVDSAGDAYVTGTTTSTSFPTTPGAFQTTASGGGNAFVTKLNPTGTGLIYSTYLGGSNNDGATSIAVDSSGNAYVTGWTRSTNFPTLNPIQAQKASGVDSAGYPSSDVFVTTLNSTGTGLLFSTFYGGAGGTLSKKGTFTGSNGDEYGYALALDTAGNVYVTGSTSVNGEPISTSFPTTAGAYDTTPGGGFVFKIDPPAGGTTSSTVASPSLSTTARPSTVAAGSLVVANVTPVTVDSRLPQLATSRSSLGTSAEGQDQARGLNAALLAQLQMDNAPLLASMLQNSDAYLAALSALSGNHSRHHS